jgi:hypothetical protein
VRGFLVTRWRRARTTLRRRDAEGALAGGDAAKRDARLAGVDVCVGVEAGLARVPGRTRAHRLRWRHRRAAAGGGARGAAVRHVLGAARPHAHHPARAHRATEPPNDGQHLLAFAKVPLCNVYHGELGRLPEPWWTSGRGAALVGLRGLSAVGLLRHARVDGPRSCATSLADASRAAASRGAAHRTAPVP